MVMKKQRKWLETRWGGRRERTRERGGPPLSADKRQKWMNPIGRWASSSFLSPRFHELGTHFIEICEIREAARRVIDHCVTPAHTFCRLHNKIHKWHFFGVGIITATTNVFLFQGQTKGLNSVAEENVFLKTAAKCKIIIKIFPENSSEIYIFFFF